LIAGGLATAVGSPLVAMSAPGDTTPISGSIFRDSNGNGVADAGEAGQGGITVRATAADGTSTTATSAASGLYSLNLTTIGAGPFRVEFGPLPTPLESGPHSDAATGSKGSVQIVAAGSTLNYGVISPGEYCQSKPTLTVSCFSIGGNPAAYAIKSFNSATPNATADVQTSTQAKVGTVAGAAYQRSSKTQFWGAYMKRHSPLGPSGAGAIYKLMPGPDGVSATADDTSSLYVNLNAVIAGNPAGVDSRPTGFSDWMNDTVFDQVGKVGFGDLDMTADGRYLLAVSLGDRKLYQIDTHNNPTLTPTAADITGVDVPNPSDCADADHRPFGLGMRDGIAYLGMVCSGESANAKSALRMYVYTYNPVSRTFNPTPALNESLGFQRGCATQDLAGIGVFTCNNPAIQRFWNPWRPTYDIADFASSVVFGQTVLARPMPILSDIEFAGNSMVLGFRDRAGDLLGNFPSFSGGILGSSAGDILNACLTTTNGWALESNAKSVPSCATPFTSSGTNTGQGPGNGEFYWQDYSGNSTAAGSSLQETAQGSLVHLPDTGAIVSTMVDPTDQPFQGGTRWFNPMNGNRMAPYAKRLYDGVADPARFGKANGLGDIEAICEEAPLEIGNVVWYDADHDGIQDSTEVGIPGVTVQLLSATGEVLATATTDSTGHYWFVSAGAPNLPATPGANVGVVAGGIATNTNYSIQFNPAGAQLSGIVSATAAELQLTGVNAGSNDAIDSDPSLVGGIATISLTTGGPGANNHTYDAGYAVPPATTTSTSTSTSTSTTSTTAATTSTTTSTTAATTTSTTAATTTSTTIAPTVLGTSAIRTTTTVAASVAGTTTSRLVTTGSNALPMLIGGIAMVALGAQMLFAGRRRDRRS
jgi:hypothetical protein